MPTFNYQFSVDAPLEAVLNFHQDTNALKTLTPPPIFVQIHENEPLAEGSIKRFTLWFGPFPVQWLAKHSEVSEKGFTDTQVHGPLKHWRHRHSFTALSARSTQISEHIEYEYAGGIKALTGRLFFSKPALYMLFSARKLITRRQLRRRMDQQS